MKNILRPSIKLTLRQRLTLLLAAVLLLAFILFGLMYRDRVGLNLFEHLAGLGSEEGAATFSHGARSEDLFFALDFQLLICSDSAIQLFSPRGELLLREQTGFSNPAFSSNGKQAVVYDADGQQLYVIAKEKIVHSMSFPSEQYVRSATLNQSGWLAVTAKQPGYRGVVSIYNASYEQVMTISLSEHYPVDAVVAPDSKGVYILTEGQKEGVFESRLLYYTFQDEEPRAQISLGDQVVLSMRSTASRVWVLSERGLYTLLSTGELAMPYDFGGDYLRQASLHGTDFAALLLSPSQSGSTGRLLTIDPDGIELGALELEKQVLAIASAGRYVAVLTANELLLYNRDLTRVLGTTEEIQGVRTISLFSDGSLCMISDELVRLQLH